MPPSDINEQLVKHLADMHSIEVQAQAQMKAAPKMAGTDELARMYEEHERETAEQKRMVDERLEAHGESPSKLKDVVAGATAVPFILFAKSQPDTPGKLATHALSYEHMEFAGYELLQRVAQRAGDTETAEVARTIAAQELAMAERIESHFDETVEASLRDKSSEDIRKDVVKYLADAHAIENQSIQLLESGRKIIREGALAKALDDHLDESRAQQAAVAARLEALGGSPNKLKDAALRLGALNWGGFFQAQPDTPAKLAGFAHAVEFLEVGAYEQLERVARRAGDEETTRIADRIIGEERAAGAAIAALWDAAVDATLEKRGLAGATR
jgi:ferritin-like metal-binding protein YciE